MKRIKDRMVNILKRNCPSEWLIVSYMNQILVMLPRKCTSVDLLLSVAERLIVKIIQRNCYMRSEEVTIYIRTGMEEKKVVLQKTIDLISAPVLPTT